MLQYEPILTITATWAPEISYRIERMSFGRRLELTRQVRTLLSKHQFHSASDEPLDQVEASALAMEIDELYWHWGFHDIEGLAIGGEPATKTSLLERGPEPLVLEILARIKEECGLTEQERKN